ncbi:MAG: hypothetical protein VKJ24_20600 [Synechococcales bacterium]|nr:hypothetical protein [Synechococcales bacterium]
MWKEFVGLGICAIVLVGCGESRQSGETRTSMQPLPEVSSTVSASSPSKADVRRQQAIASLQQVQQKSELLTQQMSGRQQTINQLLAEATHLEQELATFKGKVKEYILQHKMEVACMGALGMSLDESNQFSQDAKDAAALVTLGCGIAAVSNGEFAGSVAQVFDQLVQAGSRGNDMTQRLQQVQTILVAEQEKLGQEQAKAQDLEIEMKGYQSQLEM